MKRGTLAWKQCAPLDQAVSSERANDCAGLAMKSSLGTTSRRSSRWPLKLLAFLWFKLEWGRWTRRLAKQCVCYRTTCERPRTPCHPFGFLLPSCPATRCIMMHALKLALFSRRRHAMSVCRLRRSVLSPHTSHEACLCPCPCPFLSVYRRSFNSIPTFLHPAVSVHFARSRSVASSFP